MSGSDSSPETPTRGIEPPDHGYGPPPPPDFGIVPKPPQVSPAPAAEYSDAEYTDESIYGQPGVPAQRTSRPWAFPAIIGAIVAVMFLVLGLIVVGIGGLVDLTGDPGEAGPASGADDSDQSNPFQDQSDPGPGSGSGSGAVESSLQGMIDEYKTARDDGSLWTEIPDTNYNRTALSAFLYLLTDMKLAASFGADTSDYLERANALEKKLLTEKPLGTDISIKLQDRTFTYDGDTGEGGYTTNP